MKENIEKLRTRDPKITISLNSEQSVVRVIRGKLSDSVSLAELGKKPFKFARQFISDNRALFAKIDEKTDLIDGPVRIHRKGTTHVVFYQKHGQALVNGSNLSIHYSDDGSVYLLKSNLVHGIDVPQNPKIKAEQAVKAAEEHAGKGARFYHEIKPLLIVVNEKVFHPDKDRAQYHLCWKLTIIWPDGNKEPNWIYYIDALDGKVLHRHSADETGTGTGNYSQGTSLNSESFGGTNRLRDTSTSSAWPEVVKPAVHTYDDAGSTSYTSTNYSEDADDDWDNVGPPRPPNRVDDQGCEVDIHRFVGYIISYYYFTHGYNGWDDAGIDAIAHAHNEKYNNNAFWSSTYKQIYFADGNGDPGDIGATRDFMCPLDTVAHEYNHGVKYYLNVIQDYAGEPGSLNEATSDLFGALIALLYPSDDPWPWHHGRQYRLDGTVGRNMIDPSRDATGAVQYDDTNNITKENSIANGFYPDHYSIRYTGAGNSNGRHWNCPIITHAVYLMINGGTHRLSSVVVTGMDVAPVEQILWDVLSTGVLTNSSNFVDLRLAFIQVCMTLFPKNLDYLASVKTAFHAVGIGPDLYIRDRLEDQGEEPGTLSCMSPDIILRQQQADAATLAQIADPTNGSLCQEIEFGAGDHSVYFRIFNRGCNPNATASGTFRLFISPVSTFPSPNTWHEVGHYDFPEVPAKADLTDPPGLWVPTAADQCITLQSALINQLGVGHYCFIGIIESPDDPPPDWNLITEYSQFHDYISKSNNYAWRNVNINDDIQPDQTGEFEAIEHVFQMNGFGKMYKPRTLEIDTRYLPRKTQILLLLPKTKIPGIKAYETVTTSDRPFVTSAFFREKSFGKFRFRPVPLSELAMIKDAEIGLSKEIREIIRDFFPIIVSPEKLLRLTGIVLKHGEKMDVRFLVKLPKGIEQQKVDLTFRELMKNKIMGQITYIYKLRKRKFGKN
ncbi:MAG: M4 family metallopeptidase [Candidatus Thorarchaeota archaeon]